MFIFYNVCGNVFRKTTDQIIFFLNRSACIANEIYTSYARKVSRNKKYTTLALKISYYELKSDSSKFTQVY